jgi:hypothetical protein
MKPYVAFFFLLKFALLVQFALIFANKETTDSWVYMLTEIVFKTAIAIFLEFFLLYRVIDGIDIEDKIIV